MNRPMSRPRTPNNRVHIVENDPTKHEVYVPIGKGSKKKSK